MAVATPNRSVDEVMSTGRGRNRNLELLEAIDATAGALGEVVEGNPDARQQLDGVLSTLGVATAVFRDVNAELPVGRLALNEPLNEILGEVLEALRYIRVAAIALQNPGPLSPKAVGQANEAAGLLERGLTEFLRRFRKFLGDQASPGLQLRLFPVLDRYEEQLEAHQLVVEVRETREEAKKVLSDTRRAAGVTSETSLARHFGEYAQREQRNADFLRGGCIAVLLAIVGVATVLLVDHESTRLTTDHELARLAITIPLAALAAYLGREATRHRRIARRARELEIQLETVDAFTGPLPDQLRDQLRTELGRQVFTAAYDGTSDDGGGGPSVIGDASDLIEKIAELLKSASAAKSS
jgi:hypothetical protein